ncbi:MAG: bifunctional metallophosphatase/5'-nucleotidase [Syntrophomonadaceae bacterium]|jgi:5'-nucleotidase/UDP-sugar diphosphatase
MIVEKKGIKVAIIGLTTPETLNQANPKVISAYKFEEPAATVNSLVPQLKQQGAQVIIVLGHIGGYQDKDTIAGEVVQLANNITGVDAIVSGHTHQKIAGFVNNIPVVQAYYNGRTVGKLTLRYSPQTQRIITAVPSLLDVPISDLTKDEQIKAIIDADQKEIAVLKNEIIGSAAHDLVHERGRVSVLGSWFTDTMRQTAGADIALQNGGGLRTSIPAGNITIGKVWELLPFDNTLVTMNLKGSQILKIMEYGINNPDYGSIQYSGLKVTYNPLLPQGQRIVKAILTDGSALNPDKTYRVVTNDFMAGGGDGYTMFLEGTDIADMHQPVRDIFIEVIKKLNTIEFQADDHLQITGTPETLISFNTVDNQVLFRNAA